MAVTSRGASRKPCQWIGMGVWSSSRGMWWKPTLTHITGCVRASPFAHLSTEVPRPRQAGSLLPLDSRSQARYWVTYRSFEV